MLRDDKSVKYQNEKIQYNDIMVGYYQDMKKDPDARLQKDEIEEQIAYHERLGVYHKKRLGILMREVEQMRDISPITITLKSQNEDA